MSLLTCIVVHDCYVCLMNRWSCFQCLTYTVSKAEYEDGFAKQVMQYALCVLLAAGLWFIAPLPLATAVAVSLASSDGCGRVIDVGRGRV